MNQLDQLNEYLRMVAGPHPHGKLINLRWRVKDGAGETVGMNRAFIPADGTKHQVARVAQLAAKTDVYAGVALRDQRDGGKKGVSGSHLVWCEIDSPFAHLLIRKANVPPTMTVASGGNGHLHGYWRLDRFLEPAATESANRALAAHLGGDPVSTDVARILRPAGTFNHKRGEPVRVRLVEHDPARVYAIEDVIRGMSDPKAHEIAAREAQTKNAAVRREALASTDRDGQAIGDALKSLRPVEWVAAISGEEPNRDGKVHCPCHADGSPSLHLYDDGAHCYSACGPVDIYDYAAATWGTTTKGDDFKRLRARLGYELLGIDNRDTSRGSRPCARDTSATAKGAGWAADTAHRPRNGAVAMKGAER